MHYINYYFKELEYDENIIKGVFIAPDCDVYCRFVLYRDSNTYDIFDNNKPEADIVPIPFYRILKKPEESGELRTIEAKISY